LSCWQGRIRAPPRRTVKTSSRGSSGPRRWHVHRNNSTLALRAGSHQPSCVIVVRGASAHRAAGPRLPFPPHRAEYARWGPRVRSVVNRALRRWRSRSRRRFGVIRATVRNRVDNQLFRPRVANRRRRRFDRLRARFSEPDHAAHRSLASRLAR